MNDFTEHWTEWINPDDLRNYYDIKYIEDGWYISCGEDWVYVTKEDDQFFITVWKNDPRPQLKIMLESAVR